MRLSSHAFAVNTADECFHTALSEITPNSYTKVQRNTTALQRLHEGEDDLCTHTCSGQHVAHAGFPRLSQKFCNVKPRFSSKARL